MTIKKRLTILAVSIASIMFVMIILMNYAMNRIEGLRDTGSLLGKVEIDMLSLRRSEKDFLSRRSLKYRDAFNQRVKSLDMRLVELSDEVQTLDLNRETVDNLVKDLKQYSALFNEVSALQEIIGLDEKSGLYGKLRDSVRNAEGLIKEIGENRLMVDMLMLRRNEKDFMLRMNPKYLTQFDDNYNRLLNALSTASIGESAQQGIQTSMQLYRKSFHQFADSSKTKGLTSKDGKLGELRNAVHNAENKIEVMHSYLSTEIVSIRTTLKATIATTSIILAIVLIFAVLAIMRSITRRLDAVDARMRDIAHGNGDLTKKLDVTGSDEITQIGKSFNLFITKIHDVIKELKSASERLATSSIQMSQSSSQSLQNMQHLNGETSQVATAMTQMTASVGEVARNVESAAQAARNSDGEANKGQKVVTETITSINSLASEVQQVANVIEKLAADSQEIGGILDVIRGIADQTNLLALNAAIEAARAGEQGRGFAVVADEVRTLAKRTQESTEEIQRMIEHVQAGAANAVSAMENGRSLAEKSVHEAEAAGSSLVSITEAAHTISDLNTQIASAVEEQSSVATEIDHNIHNISDDAEETTNHANDIAGTSNEIAQLMSTLNNLVKQFRIAG
ncbi:MAG: methyl-accepting chemotaxis protein [Candidatus Thiodiazotropha sp. (ex Codakia rugifera)]|nr:methyl-accepting chemotaxis protein [Candidatus Thiodiazotropha sp. (ex Codakia rugifera)]